MKKKILFLDIDGVVNCINTSQRHRGYIGIDPYMAFMVGKIQLDTDCDVVLSSTWRLIPESLEEVKKQVVPLLDVTPNFYGKTDRGCEVKDWLDNYYLENNNDIEVRYAILDDNADFHKDQHLFKTSWMTGITEDIAKAVTDYLNGDEDYDPANREDVARVEPDREGEGS